MLAGQVMNIIVVEAIPILLYSWRLEPDHCDAQQVNATTARK